MHFKKGKRLSLLRLALLITGVVCFVLLAWMSSYIERHNWRKTPFDLDHWVNKRPQVNDIAPTLPAIFQKIKEFGTVELTVRMSSRRDIVELFFCDFLRSASLFWSPLYGPVTVIVDSIDLSGNYFPAELAHRTLPFKVRIVPEVPPANSMRFERISKYMKSRGFGYSLQLYSSFLMDRYTNASIIAWSDTDVIFTTVVTPGRIKRNGRILVKGANTYHLGYLSGWSLMTRAFLGLANIADFMTFFPAFVYPSTIRNCRQYIMRRFKSTDFEEAFMDAVLSGPPGVLVSPVNVIFSYAFYFEKHLYEFHIDTWQESLDTYNAKYLMSGHLLSLNDSTPDLHVGIHSRYCPSKNQDFETAVCHAQKHIPDLKRPFCTLRTHSPNFLLLKFESRVSHTETWCKDSLMTSCMSLIEAHEADVAEYTRYFPFTAQPMVQVENVAKGNYGVTCPSISVF